MRDAPRIADVLFQVEAVDARVASSVCCGTDTKELSTDSPGGGL